MEENMTTMAIIGILMWLPGKIRAYLNWRKFFFAPLRWSREELGRLPKGSL